MIVHPPDHPPSGPPLRQPLPPPDQALARRNAAAALARIDYVRAAIAIGATDRRIIFQHIFPNVMSHVIVAVTLAIPQVVLLES